MLKFKLGSLFLITTLAALVVVSMGRDNLGGNVSVETQIKNLAGSCLNDALPLIGNPEDLVLSSDTIGRVSTIYARLDNSTILALHLKIDPNDTALLGTDESWSFDKMGHANIKKVVLSYHDESYSEGVPTSD